MIAYDLAHRPKDLLDIIELQNANLSKVISKSEALEQGFVTIVYDFELLNKMNHPYPHIVARDQNKVIGYTLVMLKSIGKDIPIVLPMIEFIHQMTYQKQALKNARYFIMGQVCIDKKYRGQGIFKKLYEEMKNRMKSNFDFIITEVAHRNQRSLQAHFKIGFKNIKEYHSDTGEHWVVLLWDISKVI